MTADFRPRRSVLYMPSSNERALEKAKTIPCDALILDLEDAVAPDAKPAARDAACAAAASGAYGRREVTIRVNGADTEWHADDLAAACAAGPDGIVVPKVSSADEVLALVDAMAAHGAPDHTALWAMVETPRAMLHAEEIAAASERLTVLVMGTNDLAKELYAEHVPGRAPLLTGLSLALLAARATGTAIVDGVYNDVKDADGFLAECRQGREMGFDGKTLIHPGQVEGANAAFAPSEQAVEDARGILQAWEDGAGSGVVTYQGRMVESLHVDTARRTLAVHEAISARETELTTSVAGRVLPAGGLDAVGVLGGRVGVDVLGLHGRGRSRGRDGLGRGRVRAVVALAPEGFLDAVHETHRVPPGSEGMVRVSASTGPSERRMRSFPVRACRSPRVERCRRPALRATRSSSSRTTSGPPSPSSSGASAPGSATAD